ncbi:MAG: hypothetical protein IKL68_03475 [Clostridia bacterium]|nr:hypothetical protein [Clostridia bacterium]
MRTETIYKILFGVTLILLFMVGVYIGAEISNKEEQNNVIASTSKDVKIEVEPYEETVDEVEELIDVSVKYTDVYPDCGHTIESHEQYEKTTLMDMKEEIESKDLGYRLIGQEDGLLIYQKVHNGKCLNHYKVILEENTVKIYRINMSGEFEFYQDTEITTEMLREGIREQLEKGIMVDEVEELLLLIEDIES